ncbi:MAG: NYN domain-containing protein [Granulosicoccus sp.]
MSFLEYGYLEPALRTIIYIDGFNLYFGCLKELPHCRWLDVQALGHRLCKENDPATSIVSIKYFTAPIKAGLSPRGVASVKSQADYLRALATHCQQVEIISGQYFIVQGSYHEDTKPIDFDTKLRVLRPEEKQTDVNIALHMLCDATDGLCEQQVLFSNDSDCAPILSTIKLRHPDMKIGVVPPILNSVPERYPSRELSSSAHWSRRHINKIDLVECQLPARVITRKRPIDKPAHW